MYHTIKEFLEDWKFESEATLKVFSNLTDNSLSHRITPKGRSLGRLAWHINAQIRKMLNRTGLDSEVINDDNNFPHSVEIIKETYKKASDSLIEKISSNWSNDSLKEEINVFGEMWTKSALLISLIKHQIHHRSQMTILMRAAGLKVPGIYGPSYEEWAEMNMTPME